MFMGSPILRRDLSPRSLRLAYTSLSVLSYIIFRMKNKSLFPSVIENAEKDTAPKRYLLTLGGWWVVVYRYIPDDHGSRRKSRRAITIAVTSQRLKSIIIITYQTALHNAIVLRVRLPLPTLYYNIICDRRKLSFL